MKLKSLLTTLAVAVGLTTAAVGETRIVSYSVAQCWNSSTTGLLTGESYNTMVGTIPLAAWSQPVTGAADVELLSGGYGSILTISKYWDGEAAQTFTDVSGFKVEARITGGTNLYGPNGAPTSFGDFRTAVNQALNCNNAGNTITVSGIPFEMYDVIVYFAGGNKKGTTYAMNSVKVNNGSYYYPQSTTAGDNNISASQTTWGNSTSSDLTYGTNVMRINSMMGSTLTLYQYCAAYGIAAIQIIEREVVKHTATVSANTNWNDITWDPAVTEEPADAILELTVENNAVITFDEMPTYKSLTVTGTLNVDTSALVGEDLAKNAVCGAPYSYWFFTKEVNGTVKASTIPTVPNGYTITEQAVDGFGSRFVVTAPAAAKFGAISLNLHNGTALESTDTTSGLYPVARKDWGNVKAAASASIEVGGATFTLSSNASSWGIGSPKDPIQKQYLDDGQGRTTVLTVTGIPYDSYRLILYYSTDTANYPFQPLQVNGTWYSGETSLVNEGNVTVKGKQAFWGHSGPNDGANDVAEGVNAITTDVLTGDATINLIRPSASVNARATVAAIQVVKVGQAITTVDYAATISAAGEYNLSELDWSTKPFAPTDKDTVTITVASDVAATVTVDQEGVVMSSLATVAGDGATLSLTGNAVTASAIDDTASTGAVTIDIDPGAAEVKAGTDTTLNTIGTGMITIADGKKLTVTSGTLTDTQISNSGTLNFKGGTEAEPINFTMNGSATKVTLEANTYVKATPNGNKVYNVTGTDETSVFEISRTDDGTGCTDGAKFRNLTLVANVTKSGKYFWLEHAPTDATVQLVSNGNGIYLNGSTTVGSLSGSGYITKYAGSLTIAPAVDANFAGGAGVDITIANGTATQTFSGNYTGTLTLEADATVKLTGSVNPTIALSDASIVYVDPNGAAMTFTKAITGPAYNCSIRVEDTSGAKGSVAFSGDMSGFGGTIDYDNCSYDIGTARTPNIPSYVTISHAVDFVAKQTAAEYAQGLASEFTGFTDYMDSTIVLKSPDGTTIETLTIDEDGNATSTASGEIHIDGGATYADATFTNATSSGAYHIGTLAYKAYDGLKLQYDTAVTTNATGTGAYLKHHPWIEGFPDSFFAGGDLTIAVVGEMSPSNNTSFVHLGNSNGSLTGVILATGSKEDEVVVKVNTGTALEDVTTMTVPHAATARHVYIITKHDTDTKSVFSVYLDGTPWKSVSLDKKSFSGGVQCGSDFGGALHRADPPVVNAVTDDDTALINVLRVYDRVISAEEIAAYSAAYPYVSESGTSSRTFTAAAEDWIGAETATCWSFKQTATSEAVLTNAPVGSSSVEIKGTEDVTTTVTVNLDADEHSDAVKISSPGAFKFAKGDGDAQIISGQTTIGCPVEIEYGSLDISGAPLTLIDEGAIVFDLSGVDFTKYYSNATILLTGDTEETDQITAKGLPEATAARTVEFGYNGTQYVVTITVNTNVPFVYDNGAWTWNEESVTAEIVSNNTAMAIIVKSDLDWNIDRDTFTVSNGTLKATEAGTATITVEKDGTFDVNGLGGSVYTVVMNGGSLVNDDANIGDAKQVSMLTLGADATIGGTGNFSIQGTAAGQYSPTTIDLDSYTLTKTGTNRLALVNTEIEGTGTLYISEGSLYSSENTTFTNGVLKIGAKGSLLNRGSKTLTIAKIVGEGGLIWGDYSQGDGNFSDFTLEGTVTLQGGSYGTITMAEGAVLNAGEKRGLTLAGAGTVNVTLTDDEIAAGSDVTVFTSASEDVKIGAVVDKDGNTVKCDITGGVITPPEAKIGTTYYLTLAAALDAVTDEQTVELLTDVTFAPDGAYAVTKDTRLNLDGHNLTGNGGKTFEVVSSATLYVMATNSTVTDVRINVGKATDDNGSLYIGGGNWSITSNTLVHVNGTCTGCGVTIQGATMTSDGDNAIQLCGGGAYLIEDCDITGATAVYVKAGGLSVKASLVANGEKTAYLYNPNGANATGDALVIDNCGYPEGPATVMIQGGTTLTSANGDQMGYYVYNSSDEATVQKDASVVVNTPEGYEWENDTTLVKKSAGKTVAPGGSPVQVTAESEEDAIAQVTLSAKSPDETIVSDEDYTAYFTKKAADLGDNEWSVYAALKPEIKAAEDETVELASELTAIAGGQTETTITGAKPGLWYSVEYTGDLQTTEEWTEGERAQAQADGSVTLYTPNEGAATFYTIKVNTTDKGTVQ